MVNPFHGHSLFVLSSVGRPRCENMTLTCITLNGRQLSAYPAAPAEKQHSVEWEISKEWINPTTSQQQSMDQFKANPNISHQPPWHQICPHRVRTTRPQPEKSDFCSTQLNMLQNMILLVIYYCVFSYFCSSVFTITITMKSEPH